MFSTLVVVLDTSVWVSGARYIVSGDHDLQVLDEYQDVKVLSPREFAELLGIVPSLPSSGDT